MINSSEQFERLEREFSLNWSELRAIINDAAAAKLGMLGKLREPLNIPAKAGVVVTNEEPYGPRLSITWSEETPGHETSQLIGDDGETAQEI